MANQDQAGGRGFSINTNQALALVDKDRPVFLFRFSATSM